MSILICIGTALAVMALALIWFNYIDAREQRRQKIERTKHNRLQRRRAWAHEMQRRGIQSLCVVHT